jgi:hypothetical protein
MTTPNWIICERSTRWAAALRMALSHQSGSPTGLTKLHEVRGLGELTDQLKLHAGSVVLIEVTPENLEATLTWLAATTSQATRLAAIALLDYRRTDNHVPRWLGVDRQGSPSYRRDIVAAALREAGAMDVIDSLREIRPFLHWANCMRRGSQ